MLYINKLLINYHLSLSSVIASKLEKYNKNVRSSEFQVGIHVLRERLEIEKNQLPTSISSNKSISSLLFMSVILWVSDLF